MEDYHYLAKLMEADRIETNCECYSLVHLLDALSGNILEPHLGPLS
jgi:hypothetical protein